MDRAHVVGGLLVFAALGALTCLALGSFSGTPVPEAVKSEAPVTQADDDLTVIVRRFDEAVPVLERLAWLVFPSALAVAFGLWLRATAGRRRKPSRLASKRAKEGSALMGKGPRRYKFGSMTHPSVDGEA